MIHTIRLFYFPKGLRYTTVAFILVALYLVYTGYFFVATLIVVISIFILTAQYVTTIDMQQREFVDAFSFYGINYVMERNKFRELNKIVVTKGRYMQKVVSRVQQRTLQWSDYSATLIYDGDKTLDLVTREDKKDVMQFISLYSQSLGVEVEDQSRPTSSSPTSFR